MVDQGVHLRVIQEIMGQPDVRVTERYISSLRLAIAGIGSKGRCGSPHSTVDHVAGRDQTLARLHGFHEAPMIMTASRHIGGTLTAVQPHPVPLRLLDRRWRMVGGPGYRRGSVTYRPTERRKQTEWGPEDSAGGQNNNPGQPAARWWQSLRLTPCHASKWCP